ncbi:hypothetical protein NQ317_014850 [Molorchus minor]|uniref:Uncharacterized protein n=1 Tax=Molorchus minor TaxID=1323400 RepID=A0ABQ9JTQ8_9CUCU|nr:hypothetical protein NQ317_014850 [Molorchus minor]
MKVCPKCQTPIVNTRRYSNYVKKAIIDINDLKHELNGLPHQNERRINELQRKIDDGLGRIDRRLIDGCNRSQLKSTMETLKEKLKNQKPYSIKD